MLVGLAAERYEADATTAAMASVIAAWQSDNGAFSPLPYRESSHDTSTRDAAVKDVSGGSLRLPSR